MTVLYRSNRMPSKGAILITNPRRRKPMLRRRRNAIKIRKNSPKDRFIAEYLFGYYKLKGAKRTSALAKVKAMKKLKLGGKYSEYQKAYKKAGGPAALKRHKAKMDKKKGDFKSTKLGKTLGLSSKNRTTAKGRTTAKPKQSAIQKGWNKYRQAHENKEWKNWKKLTDAQKKKWGGAFGTAKLKSVYGKKKSNPKRRKNYRVKSRTVVGKNFWHDFINQERKVQTCKTKKELRKKYYYSFLPRALANQVKSGRISAADRRAVLAKLQAKAKKAGIHPTKRKTAKRKASSKRRSSVSTRKRASAKRKAAPKRRKVAAKKRSSSKRKLSAYNVFFAKHRKAGKTPKQIGVMWGKQGKRKPVASRKRSAAKGKASSWTAFQKKMGGRGLTRIQMKRLYKKSAGEQKLVMERLKKTRRRKGESKRKAAARYRKRTAGMIRTSKRGTGKSGFAPGRNVMGPFLLRLNPRHGGLVGFALKQYNKVGKAVSKIPAVGFLGAYVPTVLTYGSVGYGLYEVGKRFGPTFVSVVPQAVSMVPVVGPMAAPYVEKALDKFAYTGLGMVSGITLGILSKLPVADRLISAQGAKLVGGLATGLGLAWDIKDMLLGGGISANPLAGPSYGSYGAGGLSRSQVAALRAGPHAVHALAQRSPQGRSLEALINIMGFAKAQKMAYMSPSAQRRALLSMKARLGHQQAQRSQSSQGQPSLSVSSPLMGAANSFGGAQGLGYGALMYAGKGY